MSNAVSRRLVVAGAIASIPFSVSAESTAQSEVMTMLIEEVIRDGDMSNLSNIVAENVVIAKLGVSNIAEFEESSISGYEARQSEYSEIEMNIASLAENGEWVHALVEVEGKLRTGRMQRLTLFYVATFRDGLISELYFG